MKLTAAVSTLVLAAAATAAWGHPGHGAVGEAHLFVDLLALGGILALALPFFCVTPSSIRRAEGSARPAAINSPGRGRRRCP